MCITPTFFESLSHLSWRREWLPTLVSLPGESPWTEKPGGLQSIASQRVRHDWATNTTQLYLRTFIKHARIIPPVQVVDRQALRDTMPYLWWRWGTNEEMSLDPRFLLEVAHRPSLGTVARAAGVTMWDACLHGEGAEESAAQRAVCKGAVWGGDSSKGTPGSEVTSWQQIPTELGTSITRHPHSSDSPIASSLG